MPYLALVIRTHQYSSLFRIIQTRGILVVRSPSIQAKRLQSRNWETPLTIATPPICHDIGRSLLFTRRVAEALPRCINQPGVIRETTQFGSRGASFSGPAYWTRMGAFSSNTIHGPASTTANTLEAKCKTRRHHGSTSRRQDMKVH